MIPVVNMIPEGVLAQMRRRRSVRRSVALTVVGAGALAVSFAAVGAQRARAVAIESHLDDLRARLKDTRARVESARTAIAEADLETERGRVLRQKRSWSGVLGLITASLPQQAWLVSVRTDPPIPSGSGDWRPAEPASTNSAAKPKPDEASKQPARFDFRGPRALLLEGYAKTNAEALEFAARLKRFEGFSDVTLDEASRGPAADGTYYRFAITCRW